MSRGQRPGKAILARGQEMDDAKAHAIPGRMVLLLPAGKMRPCRTFVSGRGHAGGRRLTRQQHMYSSALHIDAGAAAVPSWAALLERGIIVAPSSLCAVSLPVSLRAAALQCVARFLTTTPAVSRDPNRHVRTPVPVPGHSSQFHRRTVCVCVPRDSFLGLNSDGTSARTAASPPARRQPS
jgi:hypothetical protein